MCSPTPNRLSYISELQVEGNRTRFVLPTRIAPRYCPVQSIPRFPSAEVVDITKNIAFLNWRCNDKMVNYGMPKLSILIRAEMSRDIIDIASAHYSVRFQIQGKLPIALNGSRAHVLMCSSSGNKAMIEMPESSIEMTQDFLIYFTLDDPHQPRYGINNIIISMVAVITVILCNNTH